MNWIDNIVSFISPKWGAAREAWRMQLEQLRNYDAAGYGRINNNWMAYNQPAEMTDMYSRDQLRARARDLERNSDFMGELITAFERNIIGGGYTVQPRTGKPELNDELIRLWNIWCKKQNCDVTGTQTFMQLMRMAIVRKKVDGGILFLKRYTTDGMLPFKLQLLEVDELDISASAPRNKGNKVIGGIEYNEYNKPVGYFIRQYGFDGYEMTEPYYVEAKDVIFLFSKKRPSQLREIPDFTQAMTRVRDANEFMTAVSVKERIEACFSVFIKRATPPAGFGRSTGAYDDNGNPTYAGKTVSPGMIQYLNPGDDVEAFNPTGQGADATNHIKTHERLIGAGQGISYEAMSRDMSLSNYSSARQGLIEDELTFNKDVELLIGLMDEIYETFVISCVLSGKVDIPGFWDHRDTFLAHQWIRAPKQWIDPLKESNANRTALQTGQKTFAQICAEAGRDWKSTLEEMAEIKKYGESLGLDMNSIVFGLKPQTSDGTEGDDAGGGEEDGEDEEE